MVRSRLFAAATFILVSGHSLLAHADPIPYASVGTPNPATYTFVALATGDVIAYFAGSTASYDEQLGMLDNGVLTASGFGLDNHASSNGQSFDLGHVTGGDTLTFVLNVTTPALGFVFSNPAMNQAFDAGDVAGHNHIYAAAYTATSPILGVIPTGLYAAFEDLPFPYSDYNYRDETYVLNNVGLVSSIPEPATQLLLATAMLVVTVIQGRKTRK